MGVSLDSHAHAIFPTMNCLEGLVTVIGTCIHEVGYAMPDDNYPTMTTT